MPTLAVSLLPDLVSPEALAGKIVIVVDVLRATTTITQALAAGAQCVVPCLTPEDARAVAERMRASSSAVLLGGERGGLRIDGFDLANSPSDYTHERIAGKAVVFTTTNGTRALLLAKQGWEVLAGCLNNAAALAERVSAIALKRKLDVHILCAGTQGRVSMDDVLCAGAIVCRILANGVPASIDDSVRLACVAYDHATRTPGGLLDALRNSLGGRNLLEIVLDDDVRWCSRVGTTDMIPRFDPARGVITPCG